MSTIPAAVASTSQPASNPAIQQAGGAKKPKEKKAVTNSSAAPLEVRRSLHSVLFTLMDFNPLPVETTAGFHRSSYQDL